MICILCTTVGSNRHCRPKALSSTCPSHTAVTACPYAVGTHHVSERVPRLCRWTVFGQEALGAVRQRVWAPVLCGSV